MKIAISRNHRADRFINAKEHSARLKVAPVKESIFMKRTSALRELLSETEADTVWIVQPENRRYLSGFTARDAQLTESSGSLLIHGGGSFLMTDSRYRTEAEAEAVDYEIYTLREDHIKELTALLSRAGTERLGFEESYLTWGMHQRLSAEIRNNSQSISLIPLDGLVEGLRKIKDDAEIGAIEASSKLAERVLEQAVSEMTPGLTEKQIAWRIMELAREGGAEDMAFPPIVASGPNSALPHAVPSDRKIGEGEPVVLDVGVRLKGYCSDMTRTVFIGEPDELFMKIYGIVRSAQGSAMNAVKPGVKSTYPDSIARKIIREEGFGDFFGHGLGHGVGLATHEGPRMGPREPEVLKKGMVVTVEPGIYLPDKGGVRLEQLVVIEEQGARVLSGHGMYYDF